MFRYCKIIMINLISHDTLHNLPNKAALLMLKVCVYVHMCIWYQINTKTCCISQHYNAYGLRNFPTAFITFSIRETFFVQM